VPVPGQLLLSAALTVSGNEPDCAGVPHQLHSIVGAPDSRTLYLGVATSESDIWRMNWQ
jgi:hypothetical protein